MSRRWVRIFLAIVIGAFVSIVTAAVASALTFDSAREVVFWPNTLLQYWVQTPNIGTPDHPIYEGTALNYLAFLLSFPFAALIYSALAYVYLRCLKT
jgi:hypothetical protein